MFLRNLAFMAQIPLAMVLLQGRSYNLRVRAHKPVMEALLRLQWEAFCNWVTPEGEVNSVLANKDIHSFRAAPT